MIGNTRDGKASRLDILLKSPYARAPPYDHEHPVVASKRSTVESGRAELNQVQSDTLTVDKDRRFDKRKTGWNWYPIGIECDEFVEEKRVSHDRPTRLVVNQPFDAELTGDDGLDALVGGALHDPERPAPRANRRVLAALELRATPAGYSDQPPPAGGPPRVGA